MANGDESLKLAIEREKAGNICYSSYFSKYGSCVDPERNLSWKPDLIAALENYSSAAFCYHKVGENLKAQNLLDSIDSASSDANIDLSVLGSNKELETLRISLKVSN